jgi:preprotein translocase subunit SecD
MPPQAAISAGYERAFGTILDSNITTLIAGLALLIFGSGPVRGFAVVHCLGILTSMFSSVVVSRALVNLIYGRRRKLESLSIGQIWKPGNADAGIRNKDVRTWNSSASKKTSRSCAMRWCSTSSR